MSQDSSNRPDDLAPRDVTILRPRPGVGRRPADSATAAPGPGVSLNASAPPPAPEYAPRPSPRPASDYASQPASRLQPDYAGQSTSRTPQDYGSQPASYVLPDYAAQPAREPHAVLSGSGAAGANPLLQSAVPLLVLAGRLRGQIANADIDSLRRQAITGIRSFEERARAAGVPAEDVLAARYAMCTVLDEAVLSTPWGAQSDWSNQSLLVTFHREASGGEKFFQIVDRVSADPRRYASLLELLYACLAMGFEGRFRLDDRGAGRLTEIREKLFRTIDDLRGLEDPDLSPHWKGVEDRRNAVLRFVPLWVVAAACAAVLVGSYIYFDSQLGTAAEPVSAALARIGLESLDPVVSTAPGTPTSGLRELLAPQIASGRLSVEESGDRTLITLTAADLFASGSANINTGYEALIREVGRALNSVPGRVLVIGHTDDQPLRSLRFKDNYELSRARALQVADLIRSAVKDTSRVEAAGKGSLEPRYQPADVPANRARNRRVEIVHRRAG